MTGKELIIYILKNNLEDEVVFLNGTFIGFMTIEETAQKFDVGVETIKIWYKLGWIDGIKFGDTLYFLKDTSDPRKRMV